MKMRLSFLKWCLIAACVTVLSITVNAQRVSRKRAAGGNTQSSTNAGQDNQQQQTNNVKSPSGYNPYGNIPIENATTTGTSDSVVKKSMRQDDAFDKSAINDRTPLPYEHLRWDDALFAEKVWRELDLREKMNLPFRYNAADDNGDQQFISILLKAVKNGDVTAFAPDDDRFTTPMSLADVSTAMSGGMGNDTTAVHDVNDPSKIVKYVVTQNTFDPSSVMKLRIKEEWVFDREASRMFVRILGIAPLKTIYSPNGDEMGQSVMFWVYYPDLRPTLAKYEVYNSKNIGNGRMKWEELFESSK